MLVGRSIKGDILSCHTQLCGLFIAPLQGAPFWAWSLEICLIIKGMSINCLEDGMPFSISHEVGSRPGQNWLYRHVGHHQKNGMR